MGSSYLLLKTDNSYCPLCEKPVYLLCEGSSKKKPSFYICFDCKFIGEVGKGKVLMEVE